MSDKQINPKYVEGEPVCSGPDCPHADDIDDGYDPRIGTTCGTCKLSGLGVFIGDPCLPAIQAHVRELEAENRRLRRRCADAIWEGAVVISDFAGCDIDTAVRDLAANLRSKDTPAKDNFDG